MLDREERTHCRWGRCYMAVIELYMLSVCASSLVDGFGFFERVWEGEQWL